MADCARMEELVQRMLQLARFEREPASGSAHCDLAEVARDVAAQMERLAEIREVAITVQAPDSATAPLDEDACASLLANLLLNAVQHTPAGGSVTATIVAGSGHHGGSAGHRQRHRAGRSASSVRALLARRPFAGAEHGRRGAGAFDLQGDCGFVRREIAVEQPAGRRHVRVTVRLPRGTASRCTGAFDVQRADVGRRCQKKGRRSSVSRVLR